MCAAIKHIFFVEGVWKYYLASRFLYFLIILFVVKSEDEKRNLGLTSTLIYLKKELLPEEG